MILKICNLITIDFIIIIIIEVLSNPSIATKLEDTKALGELKVLDNFYKILQSESTRAFYGVNHVEKANEAFAIETLLITDSLFRSAYSILLFNIWYIVLTFIIV